MSRPPFPRATPDTDAGTQLRLLRRQAKLSQLQLALISGISQRHLSCIETGRAKASPGTLHNLLSALDVPLEHCNSLFLAAGYAPRYEATPLAAPSMDAIRDAISHVLKANNPAPAIVLGSHWEVLAANASTQVLFDLVGLAPDAAQGLNLLTTLLQPGAWATICSMPRKSATWPGNAPPVKPWAIRPWPHCWKACQCPRVREHRPMTCRRWC